MFKHTILIADDEPEIVELLRFFLERENYRVLEALNGLEAWEIVRSQQVDLAVVDIMMPHIDGFQLIRTIRGISRIPIIVLSAKNQDTDKITGLGLGADDFISKPFSPTEVVARIQAQLRRSYEFNEAMGSEAGTPKETIVGYLRLDHEACLLYKHGIPITLSALEYKLLKLFMDAPGRVFTKHQLFEAAWGDPYLDDDNTVMVQISRLRDKIEDQPRTPQLILTIKGLGYKFARQEDLV
ncbi:DNA-binding response regulator [Paenibacillus sp. CAA11]|uniref:response regulator transcription factor n=1 Tax=Paenibacillus sp. CAA11 TaxID=1532905 RepID=UPI000D3B7E13|nr:response regulator transcription factor [Paenibacillus sp. CAA11]AWB46368.1 DNA-binding response regulator [Paenibacillus sp. CAA11]